MNEILDFAKRFKKKCLIVKVEFQRAFDCVFWRYLKYVMSRMGFGTKWFHWMDVMVFNSSLSVLVNGSHTDDFIVERGLRQGYPLSTFLFILAVEGLIGLFHNATSVNEFQGFQVSDEIKFDLLQFEDDTIVFCNRDWNNMWSLKFILRGFGLASGLCVNLSKSKI